MLSDTLLDRYPHEIAAVRSFFERFYAGEVWASADADDDIVLFQVGKMRKTIAVAADFLEFAVDEIPEKLAAWNVAHLSRTLERHCRLLLTSEGPQEEPG